MPLCLSPTRLAPAYSPICAELEPERLAPDRDGSCALANALRQRHDLVGRFNCLPKKTLSGTAQDDGVKRHHKSTRLGVKP